ncbi:MAG: hypothetical protein AABP62_13975 [Planctomycetota bacterium]
MNESTGINGEIRVLDEFVCTAICHDVPNSPPLGSGENAGFRMATTPERSRFLPDDMQQLAEDIGHLLSSLPHKDRQLYIDKLIVTIRTIELLGRGVEVPQIDLDQMASTPSSK